MRCEARIPALAKAAGMAQPQHLRKPRTMDTDLTGKLLIALPGIGDARFSRSVILVCAHSPEFAMGIVLNKPIMRDGYQVEGANDCDAGEYAFVTKGRHIHAAIVVGAPGAVVGSTPWRSAVRCA